MSEKFLSSFSLSGRYYAICCKDGKLRIFDVPSNSLKQEFTPDVHLTSPYTDLKWITASKKLDLTSGSKKRKSENGSADVESEFILIGSKSCGIFLYSLASNGTVKTFKSDHITRINSVVWCRNVPSYFFSCSEDQCIVQWDIESASVIKKWKCGKASCITVSDDGKSLITAKKEIKWFDISGQKEILLKSFIGHASDVFSLTFVQICGEPCVLSAAIGNRLLYAWLLNSDNKDRNAFASFALDDAMISISVLNISTGGLHILASSKTGVLHFFQCTKNGKKHIKPVKPKLSIQIASESENENAQVEQIPIIGSAFCDENFAYITYGSNEILCFEKLDLTSSENCMFIVRQDPRKKVQANKEQSLYKVLPTTQNKNAQYLSSDAVNGFYSPTVKKPQKRTLENKFDVAFEQRLENLIDDVPSTSTAPPSESLSHLLLQGLKSKDSRILQNVLMNEEENVIKTTISRLPVPAIIPLSVELITMLQGKRSRESCSAVKWLKHILVIHAGYLISNPDVTDVFSALFPLIESKLNVVGPLYRLSGRLDLMIQQIKHRTDEHERSLQSVSLQPKLIYQDEDSDDENENNENEVVENDVASSNDSDDADVPWDEISEIDDSGQEQSQDGDMDVD